MAPVVSLDSRMMVFGENWARTFRGGCYPHLRHMDAATIVSLRMSNPLHTHYYQTGGKVQGPWYISPSIKSMFFQWHTLGSSGDITNLSECKGMEQREAHGCVLFWHPSAAPLHSSIDMLKVNATSVGHTKRTHHIRVWSARSSALKRLCRAKMCTRNISQAITCQHVVLKNLLTVPEICVDAAQEINGRESTEWYRSIRLNKARSIMAAGKPK